MGGRSRDGCAALAASSRFAKYVVANALGHQVASNLMIAGPRSEVQGYGSHPLTPRTEGVL